MSGSLPPLLDLSWTDGPMVPSLGMEITRNRKGRDLGCRVDEQPSVSHIFPKNLDNIGDVRSRIILMQDPWTSRSLLVNMFLEWFEDLHIVNGIYFCLSWNYMWVNDYVSIKKTCITWPCQPISAGVLFRSSESRISSRLHFHACFWDRKSGLTFRHPWSLWIKNYDHFVQSVPILSPLIHVTPFAHTWESVACSTHVEQMWRICKCSLRILCIDDFEMWIMLSSLLTDICRSSLMIAATVLIFVSETIEAVRPPCGSKATDSQPFVKKLCQRRIVN